MPRTFTRLDVLSDVEFELAQSAISRDELGRSVQAVRQFQAKTRAEIFEAKKESDDQRQVVNRQLQIQEMQTALLQEMAAAIQALQLDARRLGQLPPRPLAPAEAATADPIAWPAPSLAALPESDWPSGAEVSRFANEPIAQAMKPDTLKLTIDVRPSPLPILGGLLRRMRAAFHNLTLFYLQKIAQKQTGVNQVYGERLLRLTYLVQQQQRQIEALRDRIAALGGRPQDL